LTPKLKKILALMLVVGVGIVWIPQILAAATKSSTPPRREASALGGAASTITDVNAPTTAPHAASPVDASSTPVGGPSSEGGDRDDLARSLEASIAKAKLILPEKTGLDLTRLASAWAAPIDVTQSSAAAQPAPQLAFDPTPSPMTSTPIVDLAPVRDPIDDFLSTHPLQGTLVGKSRRMACLGPLLLSVGDEPVAGLTVATIETNHVTFSRSGRSVRVGLMPFQARAPITQTTNTNPTANSSQPQTGATQPGTTSTSAAIGELDKLLPLLKEAAASAAGVNTAAQKAGDHEANKKASSDKVDSKQNGSGS